MKAFWGPNVSSNLCVLFETSLSLGASRMGAPSLIWGEHLAAMVGQRSERPAFCVCLLFKSSTKLIRQLVLSQFVSLSLLFTHFLHNADVIVDIV